MNTTTNIDNLTATQLAERTKAECDEDPTYRNAVLSMEGKNKKLAEKFPNKAIGKYYPFTEEDKIKKAVKTNDVSLALKKVRGQLQADLSRHRHRQLMQDRQAAMFASGDGRILKLRILKLEAELVKVKAKAKSREAKLVGTIRGLLQEIDRLQEEKISVVDAALRHDDVDVDDNTDEEAHQQQRVDSEDEIAVANTHQPLAPIDTGAGEGVDNDDDDDDDGVDGGREEGVDDDEDSVESGDFRVGDDDHLANDDGVQPHDVGGEGELGVGGDGTKSSNNHFPYEPAAEETKEEYFSSDEDSDDDQQHSAFNTDLGGIESAGYGSNDEGSVDTSANEKGDVFVLENNFAQGALQVPEADLLGLGELPDGVQEANHVPNFDDIRVLEQEPVFIEDDLIGEFV